MRLFHGLIVVAVAAFLATGCGFHRVRINTGVQDLDVSGIVPQQTTYREVLHQLGAPPSVDITNFIVSGGLSQRNMRYSYREAKQVSFLFLPYMIIFPSAWIDMQNHREIFIELNGGVVDTVTVTSRMSTWPMWGDVENDQPLQADYDDGTDA